MHGFAQPLDADGDLLFGAVGEVEPDRVRGRFGREAGPTRQKRDAPGDRVGVLGVNGVGKSTLMRIIARRDREYEGQLVIAKGATVGYVSQEPELDFDKTSTSFSSSSKWLEIREEEEKL